MRFRCAGRVELRRGHDEAVHCFAYQARDDHLEVRADDDQHDLGNEHDPVLTEILPEAYEGFADGARLAGFLLEYPVAITHHHERRPPLTVAAGSTSGT